MCFFVRRSRRDDDTATSGVAMTERASLSSNDSSLMHTVDSTSDMNTASVRGGTLDASDNTSPSKSPRRPTQTQIVHGVTHATLRPDIDSEYETDDDDSIGDYKPLPSPRTDGDVIDVTRFIDDDSDDEWHIDRTHPTRVMFSTFVNN